MTNQQICKTLKSKGFRAVIRHDFVVVYRFVNRQVTALEVANTLNIDMNINSEFCQRIGTSVVVYGADT